MANVSAENWLQKGVSGFLYRLQCIKEGKEVHVCKIPISPEKYNKHQY